MRRYYLFVLYTFIAYAVIFVAHKIADTFTSGGIAMAISLMIFDLIEKINLLEEE